MNERESRFFGNLENMFGEKTSKFIYNGYVNFLHDMKMFGMIFSLPVKFVQFFKESWKENGEKIKREK